MLRLSPCTIVPHAWAGSESRVTVCMGRRRGYTDRVDRDVAPPIRSRLVSLTDWRNMFSFHFAVPPEALQPNIPFELELYDGMAYVSIVAFDQQRLRSPVAGGLLTPVLRRLGSSLFCNLRTYVRHGGEPGVFFMREWIPNPVSALIVPLVYGLPQVVAHLRYDVDREAGIFFGHVVAEGHALDLLARVDYDAPLPTPEPGSLDAFVLERFTAFTRVGPLRLRFRIQHPPWPQHRIQGEIPDAELLRHVGSWYDDARLVAAHYSPGLDAVRIGIPGPII
jgi:uncharacterized protein YqjF (DUF2071 family)